MNTVDSLTTLSALSSISLDDVFQSGFVAAQKLLLGANPAHSFQEAACHAALAGKHVFLVAQMGSGKSFVLIAPALARALAGGAFSIHICLIPLAMLARDMSSTWIERVNDNCHGRVEVKFISNDEDVSAFKKVLDQKLKQSLFVIMSPERFESLKTALLKHSRTINVC